MSALKRLSHIVRRPQRQPEPDCGGDNRMIQYRTGGRIGILIIVVVVVATMIALGAEPAVAVAVAAACGLVAADVAVRLLGPPPAPHAAS